MSRTKTLFWGAVFGALVGPSIGCILVCTWTAVDEANIGALSASYSFCLTESLFSDCLVPWLD